MVKEMLNRCSHRLGMQHLLYVFHQRHLKERGVLLLSSTQLWSHAGATTQVTGFHLVYHTIDMPGCGQLSLILLFACRVEIVFQATYKLAATYLKGSHDLCYI